MRRLAAVFFLIGVLFVPAARAEDSPISIKAEVDKAAITIGDPINYTITIRHAPNVQILSSIPLPPEDLFDIRKVQDINQEQSGKKVTGRKFTITAFQVGEYILEPVKVQYRINGGDVKTIETSKIFITVKSVGGDKQAQDIKDIKGAVKVPINRLWMWIIIGIAGLAIALLVGRKLLKKKPLRIEKPEKILSAEEEAFLHLNQLFDSDLIKQGKYKDYFFRFSEILRAYLERRFQITAIEQTTYEINRSLRESDVPQDNRVLLKDVLEAADLAKFAKWRPDPSEVVVLNKKAREFVERSTPREVPEVSPGAGKSNTRQTAEKSEGKTGGV